MDGLISPTTEGVPQGGLLSPILSNVYLDKLDKELEARGLRFARYADDCNIFVKSELAADRVKRLCAKIKEVTCRKLAIAKPMAYTFTKINQISQGWINYFRIGNMKRKVRAFGEWLRHKVRVVILKQWKNCSTIYRNLQVLNRKFRCGMTEEDIFKIANSRLGWYRRSTGNVVNYLLGPKVLAIKTKSRPGLVDPLQYYLSSL